MNGFNAAGDPAVLLLSGTGAERDLARPGCVHVFIEVLFLRVFYCARMKTD